MIVKREDMLGKPETVGELIEILQSLKADLPLQIGEFFDNPALYCVEVKPENGEILEFGNKWLSIRGEEY